MRTRAIKLKHSTQQQRQKLYNFLVAKNEPTFKETGLTNRYYGLDYFVFSSNEWTGSSSDNYSDVISIEDFIAKFTNIRDYCINCENSTYTERKQIIDYLASISEPILSTTAFQITDDSRFDYPELFGYCTDGKEWMTGVDKTNYILTTKEFIEKFINSNSTPQPTHNFKVGDLIYWTEEAEEKLAGVTANQLIGTIIDIVERGPDNSPLLTCRTVQKSIQKIDSEWVTKCTPKQARRKSKQAQVAQSEPIKSTTKEETFMSKLKTTALITVDQNKEAAVIAAKMEAGRIINKQVIKQATKYVPFWAKGYLDTPLAPLILANATAMLANYTNDNRLKKISEFMLLASADVTVQSFNLDKLIDDVLSGIKLPAGILDDEE